MATVNPYLTFNGNTESVFNYYKSVFGGEFQTVMRFKDVPAEAGGQTGPVGDMIMHMALPIGSTVLMGSDRPGHLGPGVQGDHYAVSVNADSKAEADRIFGGLAAGGVTTLPMMDMFWGSYFGMCTDKFGVMWLVSFAKQA